MITRIATASLSLLALVSTVHAEQHFRFSPHATPVAGDESAAQAVFTAALLQAILPQTEFWISADRLVQLITPPTGRGGPAVFGGRTLIVDLQQNTCTVITHRTKRYAVTGLPVDTAQLYTPALYRLSQGDAVHVVPNDLRRKIGSFSCDGYSISTDRPGDWATQRTLWVTQGLGVEPDRLARMLAAVRAVGAMDVTAPPDAPGFPLSWQLATPTGLTTIEPTVMDETAAPTDVIAVPPSYTRVEKLDVEDLIAGDPGPTPDRKKK
jgi:hypothetical protein